MYMCKVKLSIIDVHISMSTDKAKRNEQKIISILINKHTYRKTINLEFNAS